MRMHHILIGLTLTFIQGQTDLNHENNKCLTISEIIQSMPIKFAVKIVQVKVYIYDHCQCDDPDLQWLHSRPATSASQIWLLFNLHYLGQYLSYLYIQTWRDGKLIVIHGLELYLHFENIHNARLHQTCFPFISLIHAYIIISPIYK